MQLGMVGLFVAALMQPTIVPWPPEPLLPIGSAGSIKGRIVDENGAPVAGAIVAVGRFTSQRGRFIGHGRPAQTDEQGYYEITNVRPGEWVVHAGGSPRRIQGNAVKVHPTEYESTYFPGVTDIESAQTVNVQAGQTIENVSFSMRRAELYTLRVPVDLNEIDPASVQIMLMSANGLNTHSMNARAIGEDGQFAFSRLKPGNYLFWVRGRTSSGMYAGAREITIAADTLDSPLSLGPAAAIAGRVIVDDRGSELPSGLRVAAPILVEDNRPASFPLDSTDVKSDGRFALRGLFGKRGLRVDGLPSGWSVQRIIVGGQELPAEAMIDFESGQTLDATFVIGRER